ncbi:MAG: caspase family protein [Myxococcota bacterium]
MIRALALAVVLLSGADLRAESTRRLALLVGVNDGGPDRDVLRYAGSDAETVASVLETLGGVSRDDRILLLGGGRSDFESALRDIRERAATARDVGERVELLVYYSGHSDEEGLLLGTETYSYRELRAFFASAPADIRIAILDSCASGALTRIKGGVRKPPLKLSEEQVSGYAYLTSASADEAAQESDRLGGSFFTHYLVSGLLGAADFSKDGRVTLTEAYQFAYAETLARTENTQSGPQHASYDIRLAGTGEVTLTDLRVRNSGFSLGEDIAGRVFLNGPNRKVVAELRKYGGERVEMALPAGDYEIFVANGSQRWSGRFAARRARRTEVLLADLAPLDFEQTFARGGPSPRLNGYRRTLFDETPTDQARTELVLVQTAHGVLIGTEICLAIDCDHVSEWSATIGLSGGLGLAASLYLTRNGITPGQAATLNSGFLWGLWHGVGIQGALGGNDFLSDDPERFAESGYSSRLIAAQLGGMLGGHWLNLAFEPTAADVAAVNTVGLWGGMLGFAANGAFGFGQSDETVWLTTLLASDLGGIAGGVLARYYPISRSRALVINAGGLIGGLLGVGVDVLNERESLDNRSLYVAGGIGAAAGLAATVWLTRDWDWEVPGALTVAPAPGGAFASFALEF